MITPQEKWSDEVIEQFRRDWAAMKQTTFMEPLVLEPCTSVQMIFLMKDQFNFIVVKSDNPDYQQLAQLGSHIADMNMSMETLVLGMKNGDSIEVLTPEQSVRLFSAMAAHLTDENLDQLGLQRKPA